MIAQVAPDVLAQLAEFPDGWATAPQIAWDVAGSDPEDRRAIYRALKKLAAAEVWDSIEARHNDGIMYVYCADPAAIRDLLADEQ